MQRAALLASLLKDIKAERAKVAEKDHLRLLYVCKWCLAFARLSRAAAPGTDDSLDLPFGAVAEVTEHLWISWVLRRMREAVEQKVITTVF
jgi:replication fork protection complex subunit Tof1/Swi1